MNGTPCSKAHPLKHILQKNWTFFAHAGELSGVVISYLDASPTDSSPTGHVGNCTTVQSPDSSKAFALSITSGRVVLWIVWIFEEIVGTGFTTNPHTDSEWSET